MACAPNKPLSSRTVNRSVSGGCGSLLPKSVAARVTKQAIRRAIVASRPRGGSPARRRDQRMRSGCAGTQRYRVEMRGEQQSRTRVRTGHNVTIRLPVCVGSGMLSWALSWQSATRHTDRFQFAGHDASNVLFLSGDSFHGQECSKRLMAADSSSTGADKDDKRDLPFVFYVRTIGKGNSCRRCGRSRSRSSCQASATVYNTNPCVA